MIKEIFQIAKEFKEKRNEDMYIVKNIQLRDYMYVYYTHREFLMRKMEAQYKESPEYDPNWQDQVNRDDYQEETDLNKGMAMLSDDSVDRYNKSREEEE